MKQIGVLGAGRARRYSRRFGFAEACVEPERMLDRARFGRVTSP